MLYLGRCLHLDDEDLDLLESGEWYWDKQGSEFNTRYYLRAQWSHPKYPGKYIHRVIAERMGIVKGRSRVDHIDNISSNNRRSNLRPTGQSGNIANSSLRSDNRTGFKGVSKTKYGTFTATVVKDGRRVYLGTFRNITEAAKAYDKAALELHGEFARLNFPA